MNKEFVISANIAVVKERFSAYVSDAERGATVVVCRRNKPVAELRPVGAAPARNRTRLDSKPASVKIQCDLTAPAIPDPDWDTAR